MDAEERRERRKKLVRGIILYVLLLQVASTCVTAWQVRKAILCTDTYYRYGEETGSFRAKDLGYEYDVVWYGADEANISTIYNMMQFIKEPGDNIHAEVWPIGTLYGIGEKWVALVYSADVKNAAGEFRCRYWRVETIIRFKWNGFRWEFYDLWEENCPWSK